MPNGDETQAMPPSEPERFDGGDDGGDAEEEGGRRLIWYFVGGALLIGLLAGALVVALAGGDDDKVATDTTSTSSTSTSTTTTAPPNNGNNGNGNGNNGNGGTTQPPNPVPQVTSLSSNPNFKACDPSLGSFNVTVSWTTQDATQAVLSVDGPGPYGTYGPSGSQTLNVACQQAQHTYTITAKGPGGEASKTITFNVQVIPI